MGRILLWGGAIVIVLVGIALCIIPAQVEKSRNRLYTRTAYHPMQPALDLHKKLLIVDMHADSLLRDRDLLKRNAYGHVDIPRQVQGNAALQTFTLVTKSPKNQNYKKKDDQSDNITLLAVVQGWPPSTW